MLGMSEEAIEQLIIVAGMTGRMLVYIGTICACLIVWKLVFTLI